MMHLHQLLVSWQLKLNFFEPRHETAVAGIRAIRLHGRFLVCVSQGYSHQFISTQGRLCKCAYFTASILLCTFSFAISLCTWLRTVVGLK